MDLLEFAIIAVGLAMIPTTALIMKGKGRAKKAKNEAMDQVIGAKEQAITTLQGELKRALGRAARYKQQLDEFEEVEDSDEAADGKKVAQWEDIVALVKKVKPEYAKALHIPMVKKEIQKMTKGQSLEEIIAMVEDLTGKKITEGGLSGSGTQEGEDGISPELAKQVRNWA